MKCSVESWKDFRVGDLFDIKPTTAYKLTNAKLFDGGGNPVVVNSAFNNGIGGYSTLKNTENGNIITFSDTVDANTLFYQEKAFIGYPHVQGVYPKEPYKKLWNKECLLFFVSSFRKSAIVKGFNFGNKFRRDIAVDLKVKLPVNTKGEPDFQFMECYIKQLNNCVKNKLIDLSLITASNKNKCNIDLDKWKKFCIGDLFDIKRPKFRVFSKYKNGNTPFVSTREFNNGIVGFVSPVKNETFDLGNCITVSPVVGRAFYQPNNFLGRGGGGSSIILLYSDKLNKYNGLFLSTIITKTLQYHEFKDMATSKSIVENTLLLPSINNTPDWEYMESYIKNLQTRVNCNLSSLIKV